MRAFCAGHGEGARPLPFDAQSMDPNTTFSSEDWIRRRRCALNIYGLPRSFRLLVLPTMIANVIVPNIHYDCDYFLHFYNVTFEPPSRSGGGPIVPGDVFLIREAIHNVARRAGRALPHVGFVHETEEEFEQNHRVLVEKIRRNDTETEKNPYIRIHDDYTVETHVNIIKMWNSLSKVWEAMEEHASSHAIKYERVAVMRIDVVYITPIDIFKSADDRTYDTFNNKSVVAGFAKYPVSDRIFYGPYEAAKIWATGRFPRLDHFVFQLHLALHSETFVNEEVFPAIRELGVALEEDVEMCFFLARADGMVKFLYDCGGESNKEVVEKLVKLNCIAEPTYLVCPVV